MKIYFNFLLHTLFLCNLSAYSMNRVYRLFFGNEDASAKYQEALRVAAREHGVIHPEAIQVKRMNKVANRILGCELSTFTLFDTTWINEGVLDAYDEVNRKYTLFHEAAHHAEKHHQKMLIGLGSLALATAPLVYFLTKKIVAHCNTVFATDVYVCSAILYLYCFNRFAVQHASRVIEKEADILAAKALINQGKAAIVTDYIQQQQKHLSAGAVDNDRWHPTAEQQIAYLSAFA